MLTIGFTGGLNRVHETTYPYYSHLAHDAAAVLVHDGKVVAAIEQERLDRIKHSNKRCAEAIQFCLDSYGVKAQDIDAFAYYGDEPMVDGLMNSLYLNYPKMMDKKGLRAFFRDTLSADLNIELDPSRIHFVEHHHCHAISAFAVSGFEEALVITLDGFGNYDSGTISIGRGTSLERLHSYSLAQSLGVAYWEVIKVLGYTIFDEYKVMGLAPYGDPARFRAQFASGYTLKENGDYELNRDGIAHALLREIGFPRRKGEEFTQDHKDIAAGLQEMLETLAIHVISHFQQRTGLRKLALAGGVIHNCSMNGKLLYSGMFDEIFAQPAAHDAGAALGAALQVDRDLRGAQWGTERMPHVFLGGKLGTDAAIETELDTWRDFVEVRKLNSRSKEVAALIAKGAVIGWVQGRSEFGPRSLGNRSIVADPRPAANKRIINEMVKKREGYRPFAPSVLEEHVEEYFDVIPTQKSFPFMIFVLNVKREYQRALGAITHVDGTARVQTVSRATNPEYWELIDAFREETGVAMLLNTSFNNHAEPIVESLHDSITCFLTTGLNYLVVGDYLVSKKDISPARYGHLALEIPAFIRIKQTRGHFNATQQSEQFALGHTLHIDDDRAISAGAYQVLMAADGNTSLDDLLDIAQQANGLTSSTRAELISEILELWSARAIVLRPLAASARGQN